jgi:hypothetical protein
VGKLYRIESVSIKLRLCKVVAGVVALHNKDKKSDEQSDLCID